MPEHTHIFIVLGIYNFDPAYLCAMDFCLLDLVDLSYQTPQNFTITQSLAEQEAVTELVPKPIWSPEFFGLQEIWSPRNLGPRNLVPTPFWSLRNLVPEKFGPREIWSPGNLVPRKFGPQEIWSPGNLVPGKFGPQKNLPNMKKSN